jgi:hypothetical protein
MKLTIIYDGNEDMRDMVVHVNSEGLQKIMNILMDEKHIEVVRITKRAADLPCWQCHHANGQHSLDCTVGNSTSR